MGGGSRASVSERSLDRTELSEADESPSLTADRIAQLKADIKRQCDSVSSILLACRESQPKKERISKAFRMCRDAFLEVADAFLRMGSVRGGSCACSDEGIRRALSEVLDGREGGTGERGVSYARAVSSAVRGEEGGVSRIRLARGPTVEVQRTVSFTVTPSGAGGDKFESSAQTKKAVMAAINPADVGLKVERVSAVRDKGVRIVAREADMARIKALPSLVREGLEVRETAKLNPRLLVFGVPSSYTREQIVSDLFTLNLKGFKCDQSDVKVIYVFPPRGRTVTNCVIEVSPEVRAFMLRMSKLYFGFVSCRFRDYVRILQCYRCLAFGHIARDCSASPRCGHCAGEHEGKDCSRREVAPVCFNCRGGGSVDMGHTAFDSRACPILRRKVADKARDINYG